MKTAAVPTILVNDRPQELAGEGCVADVLRGLGLEGKKGVAAAVNGDVVPRAEWGTRKLSDGDRVLVIQATQGG